MMPTCREHNIYLFTSDAATYILEVSLALWPSHLSKSDSTTVKPFIYLEVTLLCPYGHLFKSDATTDQHFVYLEVSSMAKSSVQI